MTQNGTQAHSEPKHTAFDLERKVLGAAMVDDEACAKVVELLGDFPEVFADRQHRHQDAFESILMLFSEGEDVTLTSVSQESEASDMHLADCTAEVGTVSDIGYSARVLLEKWMKRESIETLRQAARYLESDEEADIFETLEGLQRRFNDLQLGGSDDTHISGAMETVIRRAEEWKEGIRKDTVPTGLYGLDGMIGGYPRGEVTTVAAQTGAGKTSLMIQVLRTLGRAFRNDDERGAVLLFSAEMNRDRIAERAAAAEAQINLRDLKNQEADQEEYDAFQQAAGEIAQLDLHVDDTASPRFSHIAARCQQVRASDGLSFIGVDYDEKIDVPGKEKQERVADIARGLKDLAKRFNVPVVALSQYSRKASGNAAIPRDDWLRMSGKKEQESAVILHWYWPGYFVEKGKDGDQIDLYDPSEHNRGFMICTKNRYGERGRAKLYFKKEHTRFVDPRDPDEPQP